MPRFISERLANLAQSDIRRMTRECERVGGINLGQGICDLPVPKEVLDATRAALLERTNTYSYPEGIAELRRAIALKLARDNGLTADPEQEIVVSVGSTGAFVDALTALLNPGDGILLMEPYYGYHLNTARVAGLVPSFLTLEPPEFSLTEAALRRSLRPNTRAIVVCTPANPSGKMFTRAELEIIDRVAQDADLLVITDEIYEYFRYDDRPHISPATVGSLRERAVSIMGVSKTFSITGWRLGYAVAPPEMARAMTLVNDLYYVCPATPLQHGVLAGFTLPPTFYEALAEEYTDKRRVICDALEAGGLRPIVPQGAYYVLADVRHLGFATAREASMAILERARVASVPGSAFYQGAVGEGLVRFCYAKEEPVLLEACERLSRFSV